jgi:hypothetical protein
VHQLVAYLEDCFLVRMVWVESASERQRITTGCLEPKYLRRGPRGATGVTYALFSRSGFTRSLQDAAHAGRDIVLVAVQNPSRKP